MALEGILRQDSWQVIRGCGFLIHRINYLNVEMKEGQWGQSHLRWDN
jgi:hypothetical protein